MGTQLSDTDGTDALPVVVLALPFELPFKGG